jgi:hypothetical protein
MLSKTLSPPSNRITLVNHNAALPKPPLNLHNIATATGAHFAFDFFVARADGVDRIGAVPL